MTSVTSVEEIRGYTKCASTLAEVQGLNICREPSSDRDCDGFGMPAHHGCPGFHIVNPRKEQQLAHHQHIGPLILTEVTRSFMLWEESASISRPSHGASKEKHGSPKSA